MNVPQASPPRSRLVWDPLLRLLHWTLVATVLLAWATTGRFSRFHEAIGYVGLVAVVLRVMWGFVGPPPARFARFVHGPRRTLAYAAQLWRGEEPRHFAHNPLGAWMAIALLACVPALALTGWLYRTDRFWGDVWLDELHQAIAWTMVVLAALHVAGALVTGIRHGENLVLAMLTGRKRAPEGDDVE